jgi:hypothetical protein
VVRKHLVERSPGRNQSLYDCNDVTGVEDAVLAAIDQSLLFYLASSSLMASLMIAGLTRGHAVFCVVAFNMGAVIGHQTATKMSMWRIAPRSILTLVLSVSSLRTIS